MPRGSNFQKPYPPEFRREAVALYRRSNRPLREIAHDLGGSTESLRRWVKQAAVDAGEQGTFVEGSAKVSKRSSLTTFNPHRDEHSRRTVRRPRRPRNIGAGEKTTKESRFRELRSTWQARRPRPQRTLRGWRPPQPRRAPRSAPSRSASAPEYRPPQVTGLTRAIAFDPCSVT
jgi:transposase